MQELSESEKQNAEDVSKEDMFIAEMMRKQDLIIKQQDAIIEAQNKEIKELKNEISNLVLPFKGCAFVEEPDPDPEDGVWN